MGADFGSERMLENERSILKAKVLMAARNQTLDLKVYLFPKLV